jgi:hypothetical protein
VSIQKRYLSAQYCVLGIFSILDVGALRLRSKKSCGLVLNQNLLFLDGH